MFSYLKHGCRQAPVCIMFNAVQQFRRLDHDSTRRGLLFCIFGFPLRSDAQKVVHAYHMYVLVLVQYETLYQ